MNDDVLSELANNYFTSIMPVINTVYIEMDCLQDYNLGALLSIIDTEEQYIYILKQISKYSKRNNFNIMEYFPELDYTESDIAKFIANPDNHLILSRISPMTNYYKHFTKFIRCIESQNNKTNGTNKPTLTIGCNRVILNDSVKYNITIPITTLLPNWNISIRDTDCTTYSEVFLSSIDHFTVMNICDMMQDTRLGKLMTSGKMLLGKSVHMFPLITNAVDGLTDKQLLENSEIYYSQICDLSYVDMGVSIST